MLLNVKQVTPARHLWRYGWHGGAFQDEDGTMNTRRMAYWWFRLVLSGRFFEKFFNLRRASRS
jgi:hypothetical protein